MKLPTLVTALVGGLLCSLSACHLVSGSTDFEVRDDESAGPSSSSTGGGGGADGGQGGQGGTAAVGGSGGMTTGGGGAGGCVEHWDCPGGEVCISATCNVAWARQYRFTVVGADITTTNPNDGDSIWDPGAGAPDAYVDVYDDGTLLDTTDFVDNSFMPTWGDTYDIVLNQGAGNIRFEVYDDDFDADDYITEADASPEQWLDVLRDQARDGTLVTDNAGILFTVTIAPL